MTGLAARIAGGVRGALSGAQRLRLTLDLLLDRREVLYGVLDGLLLLAAAIFALLGEGSAELLYATSVFAPFLLLGIPVLAEAIPLERRAGSLDLALSTPRGDTYFVRRVASFCGLMVLQGWALILLLRFTVESFPLLPPLVHSLLVAAVLGALALFWGVRLRTPGAVLFASYLSVAALGWWLFPSPVFTGARSLLALSSEEALPWGRRSAVLLLAIVVLYLYARRRLLRPETLLR